MRNRLRATAIALAASACLPATAAAATVRATPTASCEEGAIAALVGDYAMSFERTTPTCSGTTADVGGHSYSGPSTPAWEERGLLLEFGDIGSSVPTRATITAATLALYKEGGSADGVRVVQGDVYDAPGYGSVSAPASGATFLVDVTTIVSAWQSARGTTPAFAPLHVVEDSAASLLIDGWSWGDNELNACAVFLMAGCAAGSQTLSTLSNSVALRRPFLLVDYR